MANNCSTILKPLSLAQQTNLTNLPSLNYTNQDFYSMKTRLVTFIQENFPNDFSDFVESDLGIMLIENWAFLADTLSFKMDQIVNEIFIDTVAELDNAFRLAQLVGFQPTPPIGATALFSATIQGALPTDLLIPSALQLSTVSGNQTITFELYQADYLNNPIPDQPILIPAGALTNTSIVGVQGATILDTQTGTGVPSQSYELSNFPVLYDSITVDVDGARWDQVEFFTDSQPRSEYRVAFTSDWHAFVIFGNGSAGRSPSQGSVIDITYRIGGGAIGNILSGSITTSLGFTVPGFNFSVPVTFTNYTSGQFGYDGDAIDDIRRKLPPYINAQNRAVTGEDYKTLAEQYVSAYNGQIGKATAALRNNGCAGNVVDLFILTRDGSDGLMMSNDGLKTELTTYFDSLKMITDYLCIRDGVVVLVDVVLDAVVDKFYRKFQQEITNKIQSRITTFFSLVNWDYGQALKDADVTKVVSDIGELKNVAVSFVTNDINASNTLIMPNYYQIIRLDNLTINLMFE